MKTMTQSAVCAKHVRATVKAIWPSIKFSVRSDNFAGGDAVRVSWNLGPTFEQVDFQLRKFQYGHFDGMVDMYEYSNSRDDIPQAKFVSCEREYKTEEEIQNSKNGYRVDLWKQERTLYHQVAKDACQLMGIPWQGLDARVPQNYQVMINGYDGGGTFLNLVYQLLHPVPLMTGYHGLRRKISKESGRAIQNVFEPY